MTSPENPLPLSSGSDHDFMGLALAQARKAALVGEVPVGAVIVRDGVVISEAHNAPITTHDPTGHAEIRALRLASLHLGNYRLTECSLYVTLEPCVMCTGAMFHARLKEVIFGARDPKTGSAGSVLDLYRDQRLNHHAIIRGGIRETECSHLLSEFFAQKREKSSGATQ